LLLKLLISFKFYIFIKWEGNYFRNKSFVSENLLTAVKEGIFTYYTINYMQIFMFLFCSSKIITSLLELKLTLARTKIEVIYKNEFAKQTQSIFKTALRKCNYFNIIVNSSNYCELHIEPKLSEKGI